MVARFLPDIAALDPVDQLSMFNRAGSAVIRASEPGGRLIANVNIRNDGRDPNNPNFGGQGSTYNAVGLGSASKVLYAPNIQNKVGGHDFTSGINIVNLTSNNGQCTLRFVDASPVVEVTRQIAANGIYSVLVSDIAELPNNYNGAAVIDCNRDVIAIITMRANASNAWGDSQTAINALTGD